MLAIKVKRCACLETTALGAAFLAGLHSGFYTSMEQLKTLWQQDRSFESTMATEIRDENYQQWLEAVEKILTV